MTIAVILDISPDSGYPNLCTRLGTAHHREPFRHTSVDRCIGEREGGRGESLSMHYQREMDGMKT